MNRLVFGIAAACLVLAPQSHARDAVVASREAGQALLANKPIEGPSSWETTLSAGTTMTSGNSETLTATARGRTEKMRGATLASLQIEGAYGEAQTTDADGITTTDQTVENAQGFLSLKQRFNGIYVYGGASLEYDAIAEVDYRSVLGLGLGTFLVDNGKLRLGIEGGVGYLFEAVQNISDDYPAFRLAQRLDYRVSETAKLWQSIEFLPEAAALDNYLVTTEAGIETAVDGSISLGVVLKHKHDSTPAEGRRQNDANLTAQISLKL